MVINVGQRVVIGFLAVYAGLFFWLFIRHFAPFGVWSVSTPSRLGRGPFPEERVAQSGNTYEVRESPVYFEVNNPRKFDRAEITVGFSGEAPIIEAGVLKSEDPWRTEMRTLYHKYLEKLKWPRIEKDGLVLRQRNQRYKSIQEFLANPPPLEQIAAVDVSVKAVYADKLSASVPRLYDVSLRGPQNMYLLHGGGTLEIKFLVQDMNRHDESDPVAVKLIDADGVIVAQAELPDDGQEWNTHKPSTVRSLTIAHHPAAPGVYRIVLEASDDIFIRQIISSTHKIVWKGQLYLGDEVQYGQPRGPLTVYSNGQGFALRTPHPESVQTVRFARDGRTVVEADLAEHNKQYTTQMPRDVVGDVIAINIPKRDLILNSDGFFALSPDAFFLPEPIAYRSDLDLNRLGINYVIARYNFSRAKQGGWRENRVLVSTWDAVPGAPLRLVLGTPIGGEYRSFTVTALKVTASKSPLTLEKIWGKVKGALRL